MSKSSRHDAKPRQQYEHSLLINLAKGTNRTVVKVIKKSATEDSSTCQSVYNNNNRCFGMASLW